MGTECGGHSRGCLEDTPGCSAPAACLSRTHLKPLWPLMGKVGRKAAKVPLNAMLSFIQAFSVFLVHL